MTHSYLSRRSLVNARYVCRRASLLMLAATLFSLVVFAVATTPRAGAVSDAEELTNFGSGFGSESYAAGKLQFTVGTASDANTGHVYVAGFGENHRIEEFTPWGEFVKAFGWDVAPGAVNEQQEVRVRAAAGQFKLTFGVSTTDLAFDAPGAEGEGSGSVEAALNALPSIGGVGASVSVKAVPGTSNGATPYIYVISFKGSLAGKDVAQISIGDGATSLGGGNPSTSMEVRTRVEGTAGGEGLESCTAESGCKAGLSGAGAGEVGSSSSIAVDSSGDIYVRETENGKNDRVQKFSPSGQFLLMFGGEVDKTQAHKREEQEAKAEPVTVTTEDENICTAASGDTCGVAIEGIGPGQFEDGHSLALGPAGTVFVADKERIQRFDAQGKYEFSTPVPGETVWDIATNPNSSVLYATFKGGGSPANFVKENVRELDPITGAEVGRLEVRFPWKLIMDSAGNVYVVESEPPERVLEFDSSGKALSPSTCCEPPLAPGSTENHHFNIYGLGTNAAGDLYVANVISGVDSFIRVFGPAPAGFEAPSPVPPTIISQFASAVQRDVATVAAYINPHFWSDTRYYVQYGTGACSEGGCKEMPAAPGAILGAKVIDAPLRSAGVFLEGLEPGTTYHYRFVARSGGGQVFGEEASFTTFPESLLPGVCLNDAFRVGPGARLPDCRAYEMVSPIDKNNGDITTLLDITNYSTNLDKSASNGDKLTYSSYRSFGDAKGAPYTSQYIASRDPKAGWSSEAITAPQGPPANAEVNLENEYRAFTDDLCSGWLVVASEPSLAVGAVEGYPDLYRRDDCSGGGYEALVKVKPSIKPVAFFPELQGSSADGKDAILRVRDKLTPDAESGLWQTYYASGEQLRLVCILPDGSPSGSNCSGGSGAHEINFTSLNRLTNVSNAISSDGSRVYWTDSGGGESGPGKVYLRENPGQEQSTLSNGECIEPEQACTVTVSETQSTRASRFLGASTDGARALFEVTEGAKEGKLYKFEIGADSTEIAGKVLGVAGASGDLSYVYFVSEEALGGGAKAGRPNLYLNHEGTNSFIVSLSQTDVATAAQGNGTPSDTALEPVAHVARASADGHTLVFVSTEDLTGYDNTDAASELPCGVKEGSRVGVCDSEVYLYKIGTGKPVCISCNPSGAQPRGREVQGDLGRRLATAASVPAGEFALYIARALSDNGSRLFFDSFDSLLPQDTNGVEDVYEWEAAQSQGDCENDGAALYVPDSKGCLSLISSGESPQDSEFLDASSSGGDVFFTTNASLLPQDPGLVDVYDARVGGGFAQPVKSVQCEGEACQSAPGALNDATPASTVFDGPGDLVPVLTRAVTPKKKVASRVRARQLSRALKVCRKAKGHGIVKRKRCEVSARKRYATKAKSKVKKSNMGGK